MGYTFIFNGRKFTTNPTDAYNWPRGYIRHTSDDNMPPYRQYLASIIMTEELNNLPGDIARRTADQRAADLELYEAV